MIPRHVAGTLALDGVIDTGMVTRKTRPTRCRQCRTVVLSAVDDLGFRVDVDPTPTTPLGEVLAVVADRRTYTRIGTELVYRSEHRITLRDADTEAAYPEHVCGANPLPANPLHVPALRPVADPNRPPF